MISILIPTVRQRKVLLERLLKELLSQIGGNVKQTKLDDLTRIRASEFEILIDPCQACKIGEKRNRLLDAASGKYTMFFDDDDMPTDKYIQVIREGTWSEPDCLSLRGVMTTNGQNPEVFEHSLKYDAYKTIDGTEYPAVKYERYPNHLNCIRADIAKKFKFMAWNWGEDTDWATQIHRSGLLKSEAYSNEIIYLYLYKRK